MAFSPCRKSRSVSSRKVRLQNLSDKGSAGARKALELVRFPSRFLSTIQVGITSIGILSGAIGEKVLSAPLAKWIAEVPFFQPYAHGIALTLTVIALTYFTVVIGELVPKSLGVAGAGKVGFADGKTFELGCFCFPSSGAVTGEIE